MKQLKNFYLAQIALLGGEKIKKEGFSCDGYENLAQKSLSKTCHSSEVIHATRWGG